MKFEVKLPEHLIGPTMGFYLSFEAVWGPVDARLDFTTRKMSSFDVWSTDVRLT